MERFDKNRFDLNRQVAKCLKGRAVLQPPITAAYYSYQLQLPNISTRVIAGMGITSDVREQEAP